MHHYQHSEWWLPLQMSCAAIECPRRMHGEDNVSAREHTCNNAHMYVSDGHVADKCGRQDDMMDKGSGHKI